MKVIVNFLVFSGLICSILAFQGIIDEGLKAGRTLTNELSKFLPFQIPFLSSPTPAPRTCRWCHLRNPRRYYNRLQKYEQANTGGVVGEAQNMNPAQGVNQAQSMNQVQNMYPAQYMNPQVIPQQQGPNFMDFIIGLVKTVHQSAQADLERARQNKQAREQMMMTNYLDY